MGLTQVALEHVVVGIDLIIVVAVIAQAITKVDVTTRAEETLFTLTLDNEFIKVNILDKVTFPGLLRIINKIKKNVSDRLAPTMM